MGTSKYSAQLIYASSNHSADLYYATRFKVPDPVLWFKHRGKSHLLLSPLEVDRGRKEAHVDVILSLDELEKDYSSVRNGKNKCPMGVPIEDLAVFLCEIHEIRQVSVPPEFPLFMADALRKANIAVSITNPFFASRREKTYAETLFIEKGQRQAEAGLRRGLEIIRASSIRKDKKLKWGNRVLTSEILRFEVEHAVRIAGGAPDHTIVAGGIQSCDPHDMGSGPLRAGETIILDIFPYDTTSGYYGDLTRTVVKGKATEAQRKLYSVVKKGQKMAMDVIRSGMNGAKLQKDVKDYFTAQGYDTGMRDGRWVGFFHGLGHGLGLDIHESPRIAAGQLREGDVVTVEPGLYYPDIGGIRLENVVIVESSGNRNLTKASYRFEIP